MQLEFHQLDGRWEHVRVRHRQRQRKLLASLAGAGQQTPIVVVEVEGRYLVIDGYKRIAALQQLGRDTVEAVAWPMSEAEAVLLDRSLRFSAHETALEQGWLLQEMEQRFGYGVEELARRFDRSASWVSRRLALVELVPESVQQQVREGKIGAHVAMKFLAPVARVSPEDAQRMAAALVQSGCDTRQAGQLYAARREGSPAMRQRILDQPELFLKAQRQVDPKAPAAPPAELLRELEMALAIVNRASRRLNGALPEMNRAQLEETRGKIQSIENQLHRMNQKLEQEQHAEPSPTQRDSGTERQGSHQARDRAHPENLPPDGAQSCALPIHPDSGDAAGRESRTLPPTDPGTFERLQGESGASP